MKTIVLLLDEMQHQINMMLFLFYYICFTKIKNVMKKIYLFAVATSIGSMAFGQVPQSTLQLKSDSKVVKPATEINVKPAVQQSTAKAGGDIVWSNGFDDATEWDGNSPAGAGDSLTEHGWSIGSDVSASWAFNPGDMGTTGDFAIFINNDPTASPATQLQDGPFTLTYTGSIDLTGIPAPHLEFQQFGAKFADVQEVQISTDGGTTWVMAATNADEELLTGSGGSAYDRPASKRVNLTSLLSGQPLNDVRLRLFWDGGMNGPSISYITYGWFIDDIQIVEGYSNDLSISEPNLFNGPQLIPYYYTPAVQVSDMLFSARATNNGGSDQTGVTLDVDLNDGTNNTTVSSPAVTIVAGANDSLGTTAFTPTATAGLTYTADFALNQTETEGFPADNNFTTEFYITDTVYSVDNGNQTGGFSNFGSNVDLPVKIGNQMEIIANGQISSMTVYVADIAASEGQSISCQLHLFDQGASEFIYQDETNFHTLTASDLGGFVTVVFANPIQVAAGDIILPLASHDGLDVSFGTAQRVEQGIVVGQLADGSYASLIDPNAVMIRVNMNPFASINSEDVSSIELSQFPNPFSEATNVEYSLENSSNVSYKVVDVTGKVLLDVNEGVQSAGTHTFSIDGASFSSGIYYLNMNVDGTTVTRKLVVNK
jgi:hypothetical protein